MITIGIDPDTKTTGYASFSGLNSNHLIYAVAESPDDICQRLQSVTTPFRVTIECPQTYGGRAAKGDANDLITIARLVGRFEQAAKSNEHCHAVLVVTPQEWKGQTPKPVMCLRAWEALTRDEKKRVKISAVARNKLNRGEGLKSGAASDALDAVGIAQWTTRKVALDARETNTDG